MGKANRIDRKAMRRMSPLARQLILALRSDPSLSNEALAMMFGISVGRVEAALVEALKRLIEADREPDPIWRRLWPW
ncbi:hypothetical protein NYR55_01300 [Sphingomonas sp. BGYR3]|uniref:hypothetical protein n=1 Tax=Sphingomonas sp. BGYR3 TaxID=2975483 RepID=UPI0021A3F527|nr:hypothetical protein [Sphingomonas sp. BGYR3]MDG5487264.1 hypothetical protein [Sphingomonas sp. BGYR3]